MTKYDVHRNPVTKCEVFENVVAVCLVSVSYTHLDVYKRQSRFCVQKDEIPSYLCNHFLLPTVHLFLVGGKDFLRNHFALSIWLIIRVIKSNFTGKVLLLRTTPFSNVGRPAQLYDGTHRPSNLYILVHVYNFCKQTRDLTTKYSVHTTDRQAYSEFTLK